MIPTYAYFRAVAWAAAGVCLVGGARAWDRPSTATTSESNTEAEARAVVAPPTEGFTTDLTGYARLLTERNPFRLERRPTDVRFWAAGPGAVEPVDDAIGPSPSALALEGFIEGAPGAAIISGLPEFPEGVVLTVGESRGEVTLAGVENDSATIVVGGESVTLGLKRIRR